MTNKTTKDELHTAQLVKNYVAAACIALATLTFTGATFGILVDAKQTDEGGAKHHDCQHEAK